MSYYSQDELQCLGFKYLGNNVKISKKASLYGINNISINDNSRIDDFCVLSASDKGINIGKNVHIAVFCSLIGQANITLCDYSGLSSRVSIYSSSDDYSGNYLTNPTVDKKHTNVISKDVFLDRHVIIGSGSIILPGVKLDEGCAVGALSLITKSFKSYNIIIGNPGRILKKRSDKLKRYEEI